MENPIVVQVETPPADPPQAVTPQVIAVPVASEQPETIRLAEEVGSMKTTMENYRSEMSTLREEVAGVRSVVTEIRDALTEEVDEAEEIAVIPVTPTPPPVLAEQPKPKAKRGLFLSLVLGR
jgi:hypothetical protein